MTTVTATHCPAWCDHEHKDGVHRMALWTDENFDMKRVGVSLINYDDRYGPSDIPEISLTVSDPENEVGVELWLSPVMAAQLVSQLTNAIAEAAGVTR